MEAVVLGFLVDHVLVGLGLIDFLIVVGDAKFEIVKLLIFLVGMIKTLSNGAKNQDGSGQTCHENSQLFAQFVFSLVVDEGLVVAKQLLKHVEQLLEDKHQDEQLWVLHHEVPAN